MLSTQERDATRRDLQQIAWAVVLIDAIALALGARFARHVSAGAYWIGIAVAAFVTFVFLLIVAGNLLLAWVVRRWLREL